MSPTKLLIGCEVSLQQDISQRRFTLDHNLVRNSGNGFMQTVPALKSPEDVRTEPERWVPVPLPPQLCVCYLAMGGDESRNCPPPPPPPTAGLPCMDSSV